MSEKADKLIFANQLRGLAVLAVVIVHWCGTYWYARDIVASYIRAPVLEGDPSTMINWLTIPTFNYGPFGVSVFFLISGFVIPFSLARSEPLKFLIARALRIYPTYIVASLVMLGLVYLSSRYWAQEFSIPLRTLLGNFLLIPYNVGVPTIDLVNWTLAIELKFYFFAAVLYRSIRSGKSLPIFLLALAILAACELFPKVLAGTGFPLGPVQFLKTELMCVIFMFIGTGFYHHYTGVYGFRKLMAYVATLLILFLLCWPRTIWSEQIPNVPQNYIYGLIVFGVSYMCRSFFRPIAPLDFLANISYSIYVLHSIIGYLSLRVLMDRGLSYKVALIFTVVFVLVLAYALNRFVEKPTMHLGKNLFREKASNTTRTADAS